MGVMKGSKDLFGYCSGRDIETILEPDLSSEDEPIPTPIRKRIQRPQRSRNENRNLTDAITSRRKGAKQARRCEHLRDLINMVEKEDLELDFDMFEPTVSAFAELFSEREKMKAWNDFVNSTEEEQAEFLQSGTLHCEQNGNRVEDDQENNNGLDDTWECVPHTCVTDKRSAHPSFSAEACFQKLDKNIRTMLKRRQRPMGMLSWLENEIISFFLEWPASVYISKLPSSYERMMVHALCQYLDLHSKSVDSDGVRQTQVENPHPSFTCPPVLLTQYLEQSAASRTSLAS